MPLLLILLLALAGPGLAAQSHRLTFSEVHLGVPVRVVLFADDTVLARAAVRTVFDRIAAVDGALSDYRPDSDVALLEAAAADTLVPVSDDLFLALVLALDIARETDGAFDPTAGALTRLWRRARDQGTVPDSAAVRTALARGGWAQVALDTTRRAVRSPAGMAFDFGGIGKGYALQVAFDVLKARGLTRVLLEAGGDIVVGDPPPGREGWEVVTDDASPPRFLVRAALSTSGSREQYVNHRGVRHSHVLDPRTGWAVTHTDEVSVVATDGATADALATAFSVLGREQALARADRWPTLLGLRWH
jgi:thiamine biosynthesis lipoprotein